MDHQLTREESQRLMHLLKLPMEQYGNFPLMRKAFLRACKIVHPDKGGSDELSQELISLYRRLEESLPCLSTQDFIETDKVCLIEKIDYLTDWINCNFENCNKCLYCRLWNNHKSDRFPKVWGYCLCYKCYIIWFGLEPCHFVFQSWMQIIALTPFCALNI
ncbi:STAg [Betapolyomavirus secumuris]|uniref:Small t antigen n=2 Tax=Betapolyomavirus secumuris TaxID=1891770 RepID=A0A0S2EH22_9POLY|nr:STAg [Betapolyomavirus secumuris]ABM67406.1 t-antigen [Betapolyomavirus secumuris]ALN69894.1 STAg [Betapolyomavirus secumuris]ALN69904.1 STAg [Betapolyomavirus secumuris]